MKHDNTIELARKALGDSWAKVRVLPVSDRRPRGGIELTVPPRDLFTREEKVVVRFGNEDAKDVLVIVAGGEIPCAKASVALKHIHRLNGTLPQEIKIELWSGGDMTVRSYFPLPDGTEKWDQTFRTFVRQAAEAIVQISQTDFDHAPVPRVGNCTPERILYEVSDFGMLEDLGWILPDGSVEVCDISREVQGEDIAIHRPRFDVDGFDLVWETHCDGWKLKDVAAALAFVNEYNLASYDAVALVDEETRHLIWRRSFRRMPSNEGLFDTFEDGCAFFDRASEALEGPKGSPTDNNPVRSENPSGL